MCYIVFILTLAAVSVSSRPQSGFFQLQKQFQFVPVAEGPVLDGSFVRNPAGSRRNVPNQFTNSEVREMQAERRETTPKFEIYTEPNAEMFVSNNLNRAEDNGNSAGNLNKNTQFNNRSELKTSQFVNTNLSSNSTGKEMVKSVQPNKRRNSQNTRHKPANPTNMQSNLTLNITNFNQDLHINAASKNPRPQQNTQLALINNQASNINRDNRTSQNPQNDNSTNPSFRSNGDIDDQIKRTVNNIANASNGSPTNSSLERPVLTNAKHDQVEMTEVDNEDEDRWIWGYSNVTEKGVTGTTPDVDDRANFDGGSCPTGQAKIGMKCVDKD